MVNKKLAKPKYDLDGFDIDTEEVTAALTDGVSTVFRPGEYAVKITGSENFGPAPADKSWIKWVVRFEDGQRKSSTMLLVPTSGIRYGKDGSGYPFQRFCAFLNSIGLRTDTGANLKDIMADILPRYFSEENSLQGLAMTVRLGYSGPHLKGGKDVDGSLIVSIVDHKDEPLLDKSKEPLVFDGFDEAREYAEENVNGFQPFVSVLECVDTGLDITGGASAVGDDIPF